MMHSARVPGGAAVPRIEAAAFLFAGLALFAGCSNPVDGDHDHGEEIAGVEVTNAAGTVVAAYADGVWTPGGGLAFSPGAEFEVRIVFVAEDGDRFQLPHSGDEHTLGVEIANDNVARYEIDGADGTIVGVAAGATTMVIKAMHGDHADYTTNPGMPIVVTSPSGPPMDAGEVED